MHVSRVSRQPTRRQPQEDESSAVHPYLLPSILAAAMQHANQADQSRLITLDVIEKSQRFEIRADLPGVRQDEIVLHAEGDVLTLSVEKEDTKEQEGVRVHRKERGGSFAARAIRLPESGDLTQVQANVENGVLEIVVPKREPTPKQRTIKVGSKTANGN